MTTTRCPHCTSAIDEGERHVRFQLPDPVLSLSRSKRAQYLGADIIGVRGVGSFARVLLPIQLTGGYKLVVGTWICFDSQDMYDRAVSLWNSDSYPDLVLEGQLANKLQPWDSVLGFSARATVQQPNEVPYVTQMLSHDAQSLLEAQWQRDWVMSAYPDSLWHECPV
jgi:Uncharacterized protein conserved in bacteria (DUF2199)